MTSENALNAAYKMLDLSVTKQATVLSYMDVFLYLGIAFLVCIPFILFVKERKSKEKIDLSEAMH
jgi:DHA2 family multidrug resistance protein